MKDDIGIAFAEVYDIIKNSSKDVQDKISAKFMNLLVSGKDNSYNVNIDYSKPLETQITHETKIILGLIYRDYLCDGKIRDILIKEEAEILERIEKEKAEKYSVDNLFRNKNVVQEQENNQKQLVEYRKKGIFEKIKSVFRKIFNKH